MSAAVKEKEVTFHKDDIILYLSIYLGDADWGHQIDRLYKLLERKHPGQGMKLLKQSIACAMLLPTYDKSKLPESNPENLLFGISKYSQFHEREWVKLLSDIMERDSDIVKWRNACLNMGIVHPIEYSPVARQAFNWLYSKASESGAINDDNKEVIRNKLLNLVYAYGGEVICNVFTKFNKDNINKKVLSWKSGYFFERLIFDVYTPDQVFQIKTNELKKTSASLIRKIKTDV